MERESRRSEGKFRKVELFPGRQGATDESHPRHLAGPACPDCQTARLPACVLVHRKYTVNWAIEGQPGSY